MLVSMCIYIYMCIPTMVTWFELVGSGQNSKEQK